MMVIEQLNKDETSFKLLRKLHGLGVSGIHFEEPIIGPILTGYPCTMHDSISIRTIMSKSDDLALACGVESVNIERIDDKLVIFIPNKERKIVDFKDSLFWFLKDEKVKEMQLPILLGTDFRGNGAALDLADQPHILLAGSTGSGKSVFESAVIAALSMIKSPKDLDLYLIDTKGLDLNLFKELPHVRETVGTIEEWYSTINKLKEIVKQRMTKLESAGARNIREYNSRFDGSMHYIVIIIDELADLIEKDSIFRDEEKSNCKMMDVPITYENAKVIDDLKRLIQICRASGIHIIVGTQRTSVDVVSGVVKANFPTRISLRLPAVQDSRTILGVSGAENLLGRGDMLVQMADYETINRYHGPYVRLEDIELILNQREMILQSLGIGG